MKKIINTSYIILAAAISFPYIAEADPIEREQVWVHEATSALQLSESPYASELRASLVQPHVGTLPNGATLVEQSGLVPGFTILHVRMGTDRFTQGTVNISGAESVTYYLNGVKVEAQGSSTELVLPTGDHQLLALVEQAENWDNIEVDWEGKAEHDVVDTSKVDDVRLTQVKAFDAPDATIHATSSDGRFLVWSIQEFSPETGNASQNALMIQDIENDRVAYRWNQASAHSFAWHPEKHQLAFIDDSRIRLLSLDDLNLETLSASLSGARGLQWFGDNTLVFSWNQSGEQDGDMVKRYQALEDRWSYFRNNTQIYRLNTETGYLSQLTDSASSSSIESVHPENQSILLSRSIIDYREPAHYLVELYELHVNSGEEEKLGAYRTFNQALYLGEDIYVVAGSEFGDGAGRNLPEGMLANNYDGQLYRVVGEQVEPLSRTFDPAIGSASAFSNDKLLLRVTERDTSQLYVFNAQRGEFSKLQTDMDVVNSFAMTQDGSERVYFAGTDATRPSRAGFVDAGGSSPEIFWDSWTTHYQNVDIHDIREWNFENDRGDTIYGRIHLPPEFDPEQQYPALVYYYGGTSPVQRAFTGRYPFNQWAAQGYVVYVLQPSGATGFGQEFSARHVNAWGEYTAEEIILGTEKFLEAHDFVDPERVGHMGASYGGFMTMLLATMTDIYSASMSHAGISNITSYWGQGWWGFLYSGEASKGSFPWNNEELYTQRSPIYHADQVTAPMLLLHGDADTNVPPGESHNMYTALKLLDKEVELIEFLGADHHIIARDERFRWWDTYMAFFDKHLKDEPEWWNYLYPESE